MRSSLAALVVLLCAAVSPAQEPLRGTARTIDGRELVGTLAVDAQGVVTVAGDAGTTTLELAELVSFDRADSSARNVDVPDRVWLRSGQELPAKRLGGRPADGARPAVLLVTLPSGIELELPVSTLRAIRHGGLARPRPNLFPGDLASPPANDDLIYVVKDGQAQRSTVTVTGFTDDRIDFLLRGEGYDFELDGLAAVVFGTNTGFAPDRQPRPRASIELTTGEKLEGKLLRAGEALEFRLDEGCAVTVPITKLHRFEVTSDKLVWLSELKPDVEQTPAFDRIWPWHVDRTIAGPGLQLAGTSFQRGIGMVPRTRLTYDLAGRFDVFEATIGIDDRGGPEAHAIFRVLADGKQIFESQPMTRGQAPVVLRLQLAKARTLAIEVDFGKNYDLGDFCAFADARVVQQ